ncbi:MAG TPA: hypothetical protein VGG19_18980 [Tepidisphaeraceae bacterium]|jgi:hypothetical protein
MKSTGLPPIGPSFSLFPGRYVAVQVFCVGSYNSVVFSKKLSWHSQKPHSFFGALALVMCGVSFIWLGGLCIFHPLHDLGHPVWDAFAENYLWPGGIAASLAVIDIIQPHHRRTFDLISLILLSLIYCLLSPGFNFS